MFDSFKRWLSKDKLSNDDRDKLIDKQINRNYKSKEFFQFSKEILSPRIRALGFKGSGANFRRTTDRYIHTIQVFQDKYGGECWIELGVHLVFLPDSCENKIDIKNIKTIDCFIRKDLMQDNGNRNFDNGETPEEINETLSAIANLIETKAIDFFGNFTKFPEPFESLSTINQTELPEYLRENTWMGTSSRICMQLARIKLILGDKEKAYELAKYGAEVLEPKNPTLRIHFEKILRDEI